MGIMKLTAPMLELCLDITTNYLAVWADIMRTLQRADLKDPPVFYVQNCKIQPILC